MHKLKAQIESKMKKDKIKDKLIEYIKKQKIILITLTLSRLF